MLISLSDEEFIVVCTAVTIYAVLLGGSGSIELDYESDKDLLDELHHRATNALDNDPDNLHKLMKKLSTIGEVNANFPTQRFFC